MQRTTSRWVTGAAALSAGLLVVGPMTAFAQSDDTGGSTTTTEPSTAPTPTKDLATWITRVLDNLVSSGTITQAQADAVTKALQEARPMLERAPGRWGGPGRFGVGFALDQAAKALGITVDELRTELQSGKTLAEIASDHGIDVQKVIDALTAEAKAKLDDAVAAGRLTQEQADTRLQEMTDRLSQLVNEQLPFPGRGDWGHGKWHGREGKTDDGSTDDTDRGTTPSTPSTPSTTPSTTTPDTTTPSTGGS
jgi:polyhydroxyalkanoate synthesis regulator phasin